MAETPAFTRLRICASADRCIRRCRHRSGWHTVEYLCLPGQPWKNGRGQGSGDTDAGGASTDKTGRNPEELFLDKERVAYLEKRIATELSELERQVLDLYITGMSYTQIAKVLRRSEKATENALTRAKQKIQAFLSKESKF